MAIRTYVLGFIDRKGRPKRTSNPVVFVENVLDAIVAHLLDFHVHTVPLTKAFEKCVREHIDVFGLVQRHTVVMHCVFLVHSEVHDLLADRQVPNLPWMLGARQSFGVIVPVKDPLGVDHVEGQTLFFVELNIFIVLQSVVHSFIFLLSIRTGWMLGFIAGHKNVLAERPV